MHSCMNVPYCCQISISFSPCEAASAGLLIGGIAYTLLWYCPCSLIEKQSLQFRQPCEGVSVELPIIYIVQRDRLP